MHARRLIVAPVVALAAALFVGAVIDSGQRARTARAAGPGALAVPSDPSLAAEERRVRQLVDAGARCSVAASCSPEATAARVRRAAVDLDTWAYERRFHLVRSTLRTQLLAQADVLDHRSAMAVDGHASAAERARLRALEDRLADATLDTVRARRAAGLITRAALDALTDDLA